MTSKERNNAISIGHVIISPSFSLSFVNLLNNSVQNNHRLMSFVGAEGLIVVGPIAAGVV